MGWAALGVSVFPLPFTLNPPYLPIIPWKVTAGEAVPAGSLLLSL